MVFLMENIVEHIKNILYDIQWQKETTPTTRHASYN